MARRRSIAFSSLCVLGVLLGTALVSAAALAETPASAARTAADAINDPWLTEQGPAVPKPVEVAQERALAAWLEAPPTAHARAAALRRARLEFGLGDLTAPAHVILANASQQQDPEVYTELARELAPGLPSIQFAHARALWQSGDTGAAIGAISTGLWAVASRFATQLWLLENVSFLLLLVVLAASLSFILLAALQVFPHAAHDLGDLLSTRTPAFARSAALMALLMVPFALGEGVIGFALALFLLAFAYGRAGSRSVLVMAAVLLVIALHPLAQLVTILTSIVDQDPVARSVMDVASGIETRADVERLEQNVDKDVSAAHGLAYRARRHGLEELSRTRLDAISERYPNDPVALANRGNIEMRRGRTAEAIEFYERAAGEVDSPTLLFDLSQAYAKAFRMDEYESTLVKAQRLGDAEVANLSSLGDGELVADLGFPVHLLRDRFRALALSRESNQGLAATLAPGRLGERWFITASAFALAVLLCTLFANRYDHASSCARCGQRICTRCQETVWSEEICEDCHHLFQYPEATDPSLRMARLQALSQREVKIDRIVVGASLLIPGVAGFASRRPDLAMFGLLLFAWVSVWIVWPSGIFADPMLMGSAAVLCFAIPGILSVVAYFAVVAASLLVRKRL